MSFARKITAGSVVLADFEDIVSDLVPQSERAMQTVQPYKGDEIQIFDRGNAKTTVTFRVYKQHATLIAAEQYMFDVGTLSGLYNVTFITQLERGMARYLPNASVQARKESRIGVMTVYNFTIIGGLIRTSA